MPLTIPVRIVDGVDLDVQREHIRLNSARPVPWVMKGREHDVVAVIVGGGASARHHLEEILVWQADGAHVFALNGASRWLGEHGIRPGYQVICDPRECTAELVDEGAEAILIASQVHPETMQRAGGKARLWHLAIPNMHELWPAHMRARQEQVALVHAGYTVGLSALELVFLMGYRRLHLYGYDSCHDPETGSHAYRQPLNDDVPCVPVTWAGKTYVASPVMHLQAEKFMGVYRGLLEAGCNVRVHGHGLLPAMVNTPVASLSERDLYVLMWNDARYRIVSPGEMHVRRFLQEAKPRGSVLDLGCGTGRAGMALALAGLDVTLIDFAPNCLDGEARALRFLEADLTQSLPVEADWGYCCDVMEHIPESLVDDVLAHISRAVRKGAFFSIAFHPDAFGHYIGRRLHVTVRPQEWWMERLEGHFRHVRHLDGGLFLCGKGILNDCDE